MAQDEASLPQPPYFTGNVMKFERPRFSANQENQIEAFKGFEKKCNYIFRGSLVNISDQRTCICSLSRMVKSCAKSLHQWTENKDPNDYETIWTKLSSEKKFESLMNQSPHVHF